MAIIQNHFYNIVFKQDDIIKILIKIEENKDNLYPQTAREIAKHVQGIEPLNINNPYHSLLENIMHLMDLLAIEKEDIVYIKKDINKKEIADFITEVEKKVSDIQTIIHNIDNEKKENKEAIALLNRLKKEDISLDEIQNLKYITLRFGKLSLDQVDKIKYFQNEHFIYKELSRDKDYLWIVYCALNNELGEIDNVFSAMDFEHIVIPNFAHGKIDDAIEELYNEQIAMEKYIDDLESRIEKIKNENKVELMTYFYQVSYLKNLFDESQYIIDLKDKVSIYIYSPFNKKEMIDIFEEDGVSIVELPVHLYHEKGVKEPIILKNNHFIRPFENLIKFKPGDHFDPTFILSIVIMFTALFIGDLGLGVAFILLSVVIKGKNTELIQRFGLAVLTGGLLNATVFYQGPIYKLPFMISDILSVNVSVKWLLFITINIIVYIVLMFIKNISRKRAVIKGGV